MKNTSGTNKKVLFKGVQYLSIALPLLFLGPIVINSAFKNKMHPLYVYVLVLGIVLSITAMFMVFKGVTTITKSMFDSDKTKTKQKSNKSN